jgi:hypothetical protein
MADSPIETANLVRMLRGTRLQPRLDHDGRSLLRLFGLGGASAEGLRASPSLRQAVFTRLSAVGAQLDGLVVDHPRRAINRRPKASDGEQE